MSVCEIVHTGPSHRLPRESDEATVRCTSCGGTWQTSKRQRARIQAGEYSSQCKQCKRTLVVTEEHRLYWLLKFGADLRGRSAAEYVQEEGLPAELAEICDELGDVLRDRALILWSKSAVAA